MIYSIYRITNIVNKKVYIGFTKHGIDRWLKHLSEAKKGSKYPLKNAIRKYGADNFIFEIIYQSKDLNHTLNIMEPYFIHLYDCIVPNGYNLSQGGEAFFINQKHSKATKGKMIKNNAMKKDNMLAARVRWSPSKREEFSSQMSGRGNYNSKRWKISNTTVTYEVDDLKKFCSVRNWNYKSLMVMKNRSRPYKGFTITEIRNHLYEADNRH